MEGLLGSDNREDLLHPTLLDTPQIIPPTSLHCTSVVQLHQKLYLARHLSSPNILFLPWLPLRPLEQCTICFLVLLLRPITPCPIHLHLQRSNLSYFPTLHSSALFLLFLFSSFYLPFFFLISPFSCCTFPSSRLSSHPHFQPSSPSPFSVPYTLYFFSSRASLSISTCTSPVCRGTILYITNNKCILLNKITWD